MISPDGLQWNATPRGILPDGPVKVVNVRWFGGEEIDVAEFMTHVEVPR